MSLAFGISLYADTEDRPTQKKTVQEESVLVDPIVRWWRPEATSRQQEWRSAGPQALGFLSYRSGRDGCFTVYVKNFTVSEKHSVSLPVQCFLE